MILFDSAFKNCLNSATMEDLFFRHKLQALKASCGLGWDSHFDSSVAQVSYSQTSGTVESDGRRLDFFYTHSGRVTTSASVKILT